MTAGRERFPDSAPCRVTVAIWSRDNKHIVYMNGGDLWTLPTTGDRKPAVFANTAATEKQPVFSADGRWVAYIWDIPAPTDRRDPGRRAIPRSDDAAKR